MRPRMEGIRIGSCLRSGTTTPSIILKRIETYISSYFKKQMLHISDQASLPTGWWQVILTSKKAGQFQEIRQVKPAPLEAQSFPSVCGWCGLLTPREPSTGKEGRCPQGGSRNRRDKSGMLGRGRAC